ncbi:MAG: hypothetical protein IPI60_12925 [Saprospiraceae bacterium]|nr:hypothetical protein [Saprospiraceae bacterium]
MLYSFTNEVIEDRDSYYADIDLKKLHEMILANHPALKTKLLPLKIYHILFRITKWFQPEQMFISRRDDAGMSALSLYFGSRKAGLNIQSSGSEMDELIRTHFKLLKLPELSAFLQNDILSTINNQHQHKSIFLLDVCLLDSQKLKLADEILRGTQQQACLIICNLSKSKSIRKQWMNMSQSGRRGCFYIDLYDLGIVVYTHSDQESVYQPIVSYRRKWFQVY